MKRIIAIAGAALLAAGVAACSGGGDDGAATASGAGTTGQTTQAAAGFQEQHKGGTLRLLAKAGDGTLDPHINYSNGQWQIFQALYDGLVSFRKVGGKAAYDIVPDLAEEMPQVGADGKTTPSSCARASSSATATRSRSTTSWRRSSGSSGSPGPRPAPSTPASSVPPNA